MSSRDGGPVPERELLRPATLTQTVVDHIRNAIVAGEYVPGQALPEVRLASGLGTSRGTVREALRALSEDGLVDVLPHRGTFVSTVTIKKASDVYDLRAILEPAAVRLGVETGALLAPVYQERVRESLQRLRESVAAGDPSGATEAERYLHRLLWSVSGNELLTDILEMLHLQTRRMLSFVHVFERENDALSGDDLHAELVGEVLSGSPERAQKAVVAHLAASRSILLPRIAELMPPSAG